MKTAAEWTGMSEGSIHDVSLRHAQQQLARPNCAATAVLRYLPFVGRSIELTEVRENIWWKGQALKNTLRTVLCWDQPVSPCLVKLYKFRQSVSAQLRVDEASHLLQPWYSRTHHEVERRLATEERIIIRLRDPAVRKVIRQ